MVGLVTEIPPAMQAQIDMIGKTFVDIETDEEVKVLDVGGMRYTLVTFEYINDALFEERLCLPYFNEHFKEKENEVAE